MIRLVAPTWLMTLFVVAAVGTLAATSVQTTSAQDDVKKLAKATAAAAQETYKAFWKDFIECHASAESVYIWSVRLRTAQRELVDRKGEISVFETHLHRMKELQNVAKAQHKVGKVRLPDVVAAEFYVAEAELSLAKVKGTK